MSRHIPRSAQRASVLVPAARILAALVLVLSLALPLRSQQPGSVEGSVLAASGEPLAGAVVRAATGTSAQTDARGRFVLAGVPAGPLTLTAERIGFERATLAVEVPAGAAARADFRLAAAAFALEEIVVSASREAQRRAETPATVHAVGGAAIRAAMPAHPSEIASRVPGVWIGAAGGEGHKTAIRQPLTTKPVYLFLEDGVPTRSTGFFNHNALYEVNLPQADRVEVLKGPATALYGSDAIGGVVSVGTRAPSAGAGLEAAVEGGAFGWGRALVTAAGERGRDGLRADLNLTRTDGWRDATGYVRQSGTLRWDRALPGDATLRTVATYSHIDQTDPSAVSAADFRERPTVNYNPIAARRVEAFRLSSAWEKVTGSTLFSVTPFLRRNSMEIVPSWMLSYDPVWYRTGHSSAGVLARVRRDFRPLRARVIAGVDVDYSPGYRLERRIAPHKDGATMKSYTARDTVYDYAVTFQGVSPYLQAEASPFERVRVVAGLRYDRAGYDYDSRLAPLATGPHRRPEEAAPRYDHLSPKLGVTWEAASALGLYASYGHGFRAPSEGQLFRQGPAQSSTDLRPVRADNLEAGFRGRVGRLSYDAAAYRMRIRDDILTFRDAAGARIASNAGETLHRGVELGAALELTDELTADANWSRSRQTYEDWAPSATVSYAGNEIEAAPRGLASARLAYAPAWLAGARVEGEWTRVGSYWMDPENTHRYGGHDLLNLRASLPVARRVELVARVANLTDERYAELASYSAFAREELTPGLPRTVYVGIRYGLER
ncbi:MAG: TonB-dependent receptor [Gemmatimonadota bacterium]